MTEELSGNADRSLVYFGHMPGHATGSPIIVYRHLVRFAEQGWKVHIVPDWGQDVSVCERHRWPVCALSHRKAFWPPFDPDNELLRNVRVWLWAGNVREWLGNAKPRAVLTYLSAFSDTLSLAAVGFARRYRLPLATIHHDDARCFVKDGGEAAKAHDRHQWILENSAACHFASYRLAECFNLSKESIHVLPPIPEGWSRPAEWSPARGERLRIYYAGALWPQQFSLLTKLAGALAEAGGRLVILSRETPELRRFAEAGIAECMPPFPSNREALDHLAAHASGLVVSYSDTVAEMPWIEASFPSKLIEYSHLGLPCAIVAPPGSAVADWASREAYPDFFKPDEMSRFGEWARSLRSADGWKAAASFSRRHALGAFDPASIQRQLEESLAH